MGNLSCELLAFAGSHCKVGCAAMFMMDIMSIGSAHSPNHQGTLLYTMPCMSAHQSHQRLKGLTTSRQHCRCLNICCKESEINAVYGQRSVYLSEESSHHLRLSDSGWHPQSLGQLLPRSRLHCQSHRWPPAEHKMDAHHGYTTSYSPY